MRKRVGRELLLLCLPATMLAGAVWWQKHRVASVERAPENLTVGAPRVVVGKWREIPVTPFDVYRGYTQSWEVPVWIGGQIPPPRAAPPGTLKSYREFQTNFPIPTLNFRIGQKWQSVTPNFSNPEVKPENITNVSHALRDQMQVRLGVRFDKVPHNAEEIALRGRFGALIQDRAEPIVGGVRTNTIVGQQELQSAPISKRIARPQPSAISRQAPIRLTQQMLIMDASQTAVSLGFEWQPDAPAQKAAPRIQIWKAQLLDADGKFLRRSWDHSFPTNVAAPLGANVAFTASKRDWNSWKKPLTFQAAVSADDSWPLEVNIQLGKPGELTASRSSKLPFVRTPMPAR